MAAHPSVPVNPGQRNACVQPLQRQGAIAIRAWGAIQCEICGQIPPQRIWDVLPAGDRRSTKVGLAHSGLLPLFLRQQDLVAWQEGAI